MTPFRMTFDYRFPVDAFARFAFAAAALALGLCCAASAEAQDTGDPNDVTGALELLGQPTAERYSDPNDAFARNVWDLEAFDGRIYLASGNSYNNLADSAGPVDLWYFDPAAGRFAHDFTAPEDQIEHFVVIDDALFVPGYDKRGSNQAGGIYFLKAGVWTTWDNVPRAVHVFDVAYFQGRYFAAIRSGDNDDFSLVSSEDGASWQRHVIPAALRNDLPITTSWELFEIGDRLYVNVAPAGIRVRVSPEQGTPYFTFRAVGSSFYSIEYQAGQVVFTPVTADFFAGTITETADQIVARVVRPVVWNGQTVYIGARQGQGEPWRSFGLFSIDSSLTSKQYAFEADEVVQDVIASGDQLFVLVSRQIDDNYQMRVVTTCDLVEWHEVLRFDAATFARSFAFYDGDFYFGIGTDADTLAQESGSLLRVTSDHFDAGCADN